MRRPGMRLVALVSFLLSVPLAAETIPELFQKARTQVKSQSWQEALTTLDRLEAESARPGSETARQQLVAPIAFYRGVCEANLDQAEKAEVDFATFRRAQPGSTIDEVVYSKKAVAAFEAAGKGAASQGSFSLLQRFEDFKSPTSMGETPDERWADGPVKWLMTAEETVAWTALKSEAERSEFVEAFWERRDTSPDSPDNPARTEFDRRVAFADAYFRLDDQQRGSLTDPGMVFVLLGPPTRTGRKPILGGEDSSISDGTSVPGQWFMANRNSVHFDGVTVTEASNSFREIWYYRRETLPKAVSANALDVAFVTKIGRGRFVLQRQPAIEAALAA
ncbi:MAG TPA: GWxTD domain-containing protein, partial [Thermoanaerobaculia bacterium]